MVMPQFDSSKRRPTSVCRGYVHVVKSGDTLYKLARQYDVKLFDIMRLNPYVNVYNLQIGDEICIPTTPARPEQTYVVNSGDTIQQVLKALDADFDTLVKWNPMLMDVELPEGLIITLPLVQPRADVYENHSMYDDRNNVDDVYDDRNDAYDDRNDVDDAFDDVD